VTPGAEPQPAPAGLASRKAALGLLHTILTKRRPLQEAWEAALQPSQPLDGLAARDRAFVRLLVLTVLRRLGQLDRIVDARVSRPNMPATLRALLRLGIAQLVFLQTPPHAAVATTLALARREPNAQRAFLNALLRRIATEVPAIRGDLGEPLATVPEWLAKSWRAAYGEDRAAAIARAHLVEPPLDVTIRDEAAIDDWAAKLGGTRLATGSVRCAAAGSIETLSGFAAGAWWVQDAAATLAARILLAGLRDAPGRVLDLCAAPGGKTLQLAAAGAAVTALDRSARRTALIAENLRRCRLTAEIVTADALTWTPERPFDAVLLDAPCSATGTLRRHPDVAHLKSPDDVAKLAHQQRQLLAAAAEYVRPGGAVVYAVCSLQPDEGEDIGAWGRHSGVPELEPWPITAEAVDAAAFLTPSGEIRTLPADWPEHGGLDGFFIARFRRR
jgi:16S rRNA (cytosine967-C5)-methyltransferase